MIPHRYLVIQIAAEDDEEPTPAPVTTTEPVNKPPAKKQKAVPVPPFKGPRKCYFHGLEGFRCEGDDAAVRECFGKTGSASARNCKSGDKNKPLYFHHFCMVRYYQEKKKKIIAEDYECNYCPECKVPPFKRSRLLWHKPNAILPTWRPCDEILILSDI